MKKCTWFFFLLLLWFAASCASSSRVVEATEPSSLPTARATNSSTPESATTPGIPPTPAITHLSPTTTVEPTDEFVYFADSGQRLGDGSSFSMALGDLDHDGDLDALVANYQYASQVWLNNGGQQGGTPGIFRSSQEIGNPTGHGIALGDLDGDNDPDVFIGHNTDADQVWMNDGTGNLVDSGQRLGSTEDATTSVTLADVDNDGDLDAFTLHYQKPVRLWLNDGSGKLSDVEEALGSNALSVSTGDVELDGDLDVLIAYVEQPNQLWFNDGTGIFTDSGQRLGSEQGWGNAVLADVDQDEDLDALFASTSGGTIWLNDGTGQFTDSGQTLDNSHYITAGDVDGDGDLDAITCEAFWFNDGVGNFSTLDWHIPVPGCAGVWLGDVDGDDDLDAFIASYEQSNELWLNMAEKISNGIK